MCDRCGAEFTFLGLAEPQPAMLPAYLAALHSGWRPAGSDIQAAHHLREAASDPDAFLRRFADRIDMGTSEGASCRVALTRWLWDGAFCGTISLLAETGREPLVTCDLVPWKQQHDYAQRANRQILDEARTLAGGVVCSPQPVAPGAAINASR